MITFKIKKKLSSLNKKEVDIIRKIKKKLSSEEYTTKKEDKEVINFEKKYNLNSNGWEIYFKRLKYPAKGVIEIKTNSIVFNFNIENQIIALITVITLIVIFSQIIASPYVFGVGLFIVIFYCLSLLYKSYSFSKRITNYFN